MSEVQQDKVVIAVVVDKEGWMPAYFYCEGVRGSAVYIMKETCSGQFFIL